MSALQYPALVLNADFTPVSVAPLSTWDFERTLRKVLKDRVLVVAEYDVELRSEKIVYKPPSVVALKTYVKKPKKVAFNRYNIFLRDNFCCQYCGGQFSASELTFDHVIPRSKGGKTSFTNIVSACVPCNTLKGSKLLLPKVKPFEPTAEQLTRKIHQADKLHHTWLDYLYWSGALEQN